MPNKIGGYIFKERGGGGGGVGVGRRGQNKLGGIEIIRSIKHETVIVMDNF